jgi:hypothetical protein
MKIKITKRKGGTVYQTPEELEAFRQKYHPESNCDLESIYRFSHRADGSCSVIDHANEPMIISEEFEVTEATGEPVESVEKKPKAAKPPQKETVKKETIPSPATVEETNPEETESEPGEETDPHEDNAKPE